MYHVASVTLVVSIFRVRGLHVRKNTKSCFGRPRNIFSPNLRLAGLFNLDFINCSPCTTTWFFLASLPGSGAYWTPLVARCVHISEFGRNKVRNSCKLRKNGVVSLWYAIRENTCRPVSPSLRNQYCSRTWPVGVYVSDILIPPKLVPVESVPEYSSYVGCADPGVQKPFGVLDWAQHVTLLCKCFIVLLTSNNLN